MKSVIQTLLHERRGETAMGSCQRLIHPLPGVAEGAGNLLDRPAFRPVQPGGTPLRRGQAFYHLPDSPAPIRGAIR